MAIGARSERRNCLGFAFAITTLYGVTISHGPVPYSSSRSCDLFHERSPAVPAFRGDSRNFQTPQGRLRRTLCLGLKHPRLGRPFSFRARPLMSLHPGLKHLGYSVRPLRGHRKMSKLGNNRCSGRFTNRESVPPSGDLVLGETRFDFW